MYRCPICHKENTTLQCTCGFDMSRDYEGHPTLMPLKAGLPSRKGRNSKPSTLFHCKKCGGGIFYLHPEEDLCVCFKCGTEAPIPRKTQVPPEKPVSKTQTTPPAQSISPKISTYNDYIKALEQKFLANGKLPLSQNQLDSFLREHQLDKRFDIRAGDIRRDLQTIYAKYKPKNEVKQFYSYDQYMKDLEALYIQNGKKPLSAQQIQQFLKTHHLSEKFGITAADVQKDLTTLIEKHSQYSNLASVLQKKSTKDASSLSSLLSQLTKKK